MSPQSSTMERRMSLNIKSAETHKLASELARLTGQSLTAAVTEAVREKLAVEQRKRDHEARVGALLEIARRCAGQLREAAPSEDHTAFLYDDEGLPR
jgi:antitoxin VapB